MIDLKHALRSTSLSAVHDNSSSVSDAFVLEYDVHIFGHLLTDSLSNETG